MCHGQLYQRRVKWAFNKKVRPRVFEKGNLVLKKHNQAMPNHRGKFALTYEGPYVVKKAFSGGALILANMDGHDFNMPTNSDAIIWYFAWRSLSVHLISIFLRQKKKKKKYIYIYIKEGRSKTWRGGLRKRRAKRKRAREYIKGRLKTRKGGLHKMRAKEKAWKSLLDWKPEKAVYAKIKAIKSQLNYVITWSFLVEVRRQPSWFGDVLKEKSISYACLNFWPR